MFVRVKIFNGQILHPVKHGAAHPAQKALRDARHKLRLKRDGQNGDDIKSDQQQHLGQNLGTGRRPIVKRRPFFNGCQHLL